MPVTRVTGSEILNNSVKRQDLNTTQSGAACVTKILGGSNIDLDWTGPIDDDGTGVVTVNVTGILHVEPAGSTKATMRTDCSHTIGSGSNYAGIFSGRQNAIGAASANSFIGGGRLNSLASNYATLVGGRTNVISGTASFDSFIGGGNGNELDTCRGSCIVGGASNVADNSVYIFMGGGRFNEITGSDYAVIVGGSTNYISASTYCAIASGYDNTIANGYRCFIGAGKYNEIDKGAGATFHRYGFIGAGENNVMIGQRHGILAATNSTIEGAMNIIVGGSGNSITYDSATNFLNLVGNGFENEIDTSTHSTVLNGDGNLISGATSHRCSILNGVDNWSFSSDQSTILNGTDNYINNADFVTIVNGDYNVVGSGAEHAVMWGKDNEIKPNAALSFVHGENIIAPFHGQKAWSTGKLSSSWTSQISEFQLRRVTNSVDPANSQLFLDWEGDRGASEGGSGSAVLYVPPEEGTYFVECKVVAFFKYTGEPNGPIPIPKNACFYKNFMVYWNSTYTPNNYRIDGVAVSSPGVSLTRQTGGSTDLTCYFFIDGYYFRLLVNNADTAKNSTFWLGHIKMTHITLRT